VAFEIWIFRNGRFTGHTIMCTSLYLFIDGNAFCRFTIRSHDTEDVRFVADLPSPLSCKCKY